MTDKNAIIERMNRRDAERLEKIEKAHKAKEETDLSSENEDYFTSNFKNKSSYVEELLTKIPSIEANKLSCHFDEIKKDISELQKYILNSSLFLNEFNMRKHLGMVQNLQTKCYELEDKHMPRKKFGFKKKNNTKPCIPKQNSNDEHDGEAKKYAAKWSQKVFGFDSRDGEILSIASEDLYQRDVTLRNLKNCTVSLFGLLGTLHATDLDNCTLLCGPVSTSVFFERCKNCKIVTACQQLRMHSSTDCDIYLHVTSKGIIEDCTQIRTAPYNLYYDDLKKHFEMSGLDRNINNWDCLDDFNWLALDIHSPNWSIIDESERIKCWNVKETKTLIQ